MAGTEVTTIPKQVRVFKATYANLPTTGIKAEDLGYATDRKVFYRWSGAAWESVTIYSDSGTAANIPAAADLPDGSLYYATDTQVLKQVSGGSWIVLTGITSTSGSYTGNGTDNRAIAHGLSHTPKLVIIFDYGWGKLHFIIDVQNKMIYIAGAESGVYDVNAPDNTNFYVSHTDYHYANSNAQEYHWMAV